MSGEAKLRQSAQSFAPAISYSEELKAGRTKHEIYYYLYNKLDYQAF